MFQCWQISTFHTTGPPIINPTYFFDIGSKLEKAPGCEMVKQQKMMGSCLKETGRGGTEKRAKKGRQAGSAQRIECGGSLRWVF